jgi:hypothetical protein
MTTGEAMNDLIVLVPDKNLEAAIKGILGRPESLGARQVGARILVHPARDSGCVGNGHEFLRPFTKRYIHALILCDRQGCGREGESREELERSIEKQLRRSGWGDPATAIVLDPELEIWVWSDSPHVPGVLGWPSGPASFKRWLVDHRHLKEGRFKPDQPKEVMEEVLRVLKRPRSSAIYLELARKVGFGKCQDPAFLKLKATMLAWFPGR